MNHTPTPWILSMSDFIKGANGRFVADCETSLYPERPAPPKPEDLANAEFIIRACNAHEELVAALRGMIDLMDNKPTSYEEDQQISKYRQVLNTIEKGDKR